MKENYGKVGAMVAAAVLAFALIACIICMERIPVGYKAGRKNAKSIRRRRHNSKGGLIMNECDLCKAKEESIKDTAYELAELENE